MCKIKNHLWGSVNVSEETSIIDLSDVSLVELQTINNIKNIDKSEKGLAGRNYQIEEMVGREVRTRKIQIQIGDN